MSTPDAHLEDVYKETQGEGSPNFFFPRNNSERKETQEDEGTSCYSMGYKLSLKMLRNKNVHEKHSPSMLIGRQAGGWESEGVLVDEDFEKFEWEKRSHLLDHLLLFDEESSSYSPSAPHCLSLHLN